MQVLDLSSLRTGLHFSFGSGTLPCRSGFSRCCQGCREPQSISAEETFTSHSVPSGPCFIVSFLRVLGASAEWKRWTSDVRVVVEHRHAVSSA